MNPKHWTADGASYIGPKPALSQQQEATMKALKAAWFIWEKSGRRGTAWEFILWYEARLRGER